MLKLRVVQAAFGDCMILELGAPAQPEYVMIDGGPDFTYDRHLKAELATIGGQLAAVVLSHVDSDHIIGLLDLMADLKSQVNSPHKTAVVKELWHNAFSQTVGGNNIAAQIAVVMASAGAASKSAASGNAVVQSIGEGDQLRREAILLQIPINPGFSSGYITVENSTGERTFGGVSVRVVGPTQTILDKLKKQWQDWLTEHAPAIASGDPLLAAYADQRIPNLSSIALYVNDKGKTVLLTGDARGDHLLKGLRRAGLLDAGGKIHVNLLKMPHHGSSNNVTAKFFQTVTADTYVISADGTNDNPDYKTCKWLVEAAKSQGRAIEIFLTNETPSSLKLLQTHPPALYGYRLTIMPKNAHAQTITIVAD